jgi:methyl-accepting chemotaxis protein
MLRSLYTISIGRRIFFAFTLTTVIALVAISLLSTYYFNALVARDQAVKTAFAAQHTANDQLVNLQRMNALLRTRLAQVFATTAGGPIAGDPSLAASGGLISTDLLTREITFEQTLTLYQQQYALGSSNAMSGVRSIVLSDDPNSTIGANQQAALTTVARSEWPSYRNLQDRVLQLLDPTTNPTLVTNSYGAYEQAYGVMFNANALFLTLTNDWQQVVNSAQTIGEIVTNVGPSQYQPILISTTLALFFTILVIILAASAVNITITKPLRQLTALTRRIAKGENQVRAQVRGLDEIAQVASSMNGMLDYIVKLIEESEGQRAHLQFQVEQLAHNVSGVGQGDLRARADVSLPDLGALANSFNYMINAFSLLIRRVKSVAYEVTSSTAQVSQSMSQLVTSAGQQIDQIREASGEVERMASASNRVAQRALEVSRVAMDARQAAKEGEISVRQTVSGMGKINSVMRDTAQKVQILQTHSSAIEEISSIMGGLAQRTQRLALDAAIQVNMASVNNSGFAAVVDEIRTLADQAKKESVRIGGLTRTVIGEITEVQKATLTTAIETESMSTFASKTGVALESTFIAVQRQADEIEAMAKVAGTQVQSSQRVVAVMQRVSQATQHSSIVTESVSTQVKRQGQLLVQLHSSVEAFRVSNEQQHASGHARYVIGSGTSQ